MKSQPDAVFLGISPGDPVLFSGINQQIISREQGNTVPVFKFQDRLSGKQYHPLIHLLIKPLIVGCRMSPRDNSLQDKITSPDQILKNFPGDMLRDTGKDIKTLLSHRLTVS